MKKTYFGKQTQKALENFPFSSAQVHKELLYAISDIKKSAARANNRAGLLSVSIAQAIEKAADEMLSGSFDDQFPLPSLQGGAGTSINMNVNEVIAARATEILGSLVHPNDHVNMSQSTNDVNPSALKITCLRLGKKLMSDVTGCVKIFDRKVQEFSHIQKLGRTHLQDAVPITLGEEFASYASLLSRGIQRIKRVLLDFLELNLGGTAVGNSINAPKQYRRAVYEELCKITGFALRPAENLMSQTSSQTDFVALSQALVAISLDASKIANDMRLMSSGPVGGMGEIILTELQAGSSIMPGKVNPILPESVNQLYFTVSGNNLAIEHAAHGSFLELANMFPVVADKLISSLKLTSEVLVQFSTKCVETIKANEKRCREILENSTAYATLLVPKLGYDTVSAIVKESLETGVPTRLLLAKKKLLTDNQFNKIVESINNK